MVTLLIADMQKSQTKILGPGLGLLTHGIYFASELIELNHIFDSAGTSEKEIAVCVHWKTSGNQ